MIERLEQSARLVCATLGARFISVFPLERPDTAALYRITVAFPANAEPIDFIMEYTSSREIETLTDTLLARELFCTLWERARLAGLQTLARALDVETINDCE